MNSIPSVLIIGKNSKFYRSIKKVLTIYYNVKESSHKELQYNIFNEYIPDIIILTCRIKDPKFIQVLSKIAPISSKLILISSVILDLPSTFRGYSYYREKSIVEKWFLEYLPQHKIKFIIRSGDITTKYKKIYSTPSDLVGQIKNLKEPGVIYSAPIKIGSEIALPPTFYQKIFKLRYGYMLVRPYDIFLKKRCPGKLYGYTYALFDKIRLLKQNENYPI